MRAWIEMLGGASHVRIVRVNVGVDTSKDGKAAASIDVEVEALVDITLPDGTVVCAGTHIIAELKCVQALVTSPLFSFALLLQVAHGKEATHVLRARGHVCGTLWPCGRVRDGTAGTRGVLQRRRLACARRPRLHPVPL